MNRWKKLSFCVLLFALASASPQGASGTSPSLMDLLRKSCPRLPADHRSLAQALAFVAKEIHVPVRLDARLAGEISATTEVRPVFADGELSAGLILAAILDAIDPQRRLCLAADTDDLGRQELLLTTTAEAQRRGRLVLPLPRRPASSGKTPTASASADAAVVRKPTTSGLSTLSVRGNTLENTLLLAAFDLDGILHLDSAALRRAGVEPHQRLDVEIRNLSPARAVAAIAARARPSGIVRSEVFYDDLGKPHIVATTVAKFEHRGRAAELKDFADVVGVRPPRSRESLLNPANWVNAALSTPVDGAPTQLSLEDALAAVSRSIELPIKIHYVDFAVEGYDPRRRVEFAPNRRNARAVIYDLLLQADPERRYGVVACVERRGDEFAVVVLSRTGAEVSGRSILSDYMLTSDDPR